MSLIHFPGPSELDELFRELSEQEKQGMILLELDPIQALALISNIQLALRHPANVGHSAAIARRFALELGDALSSSPAIARMIAAGWDPENDVES